MIAEAMERVDRGLVPFALCVACGDENPANVRSGPGGTLMVTCGICHVPSDPTGLLFVERADALKRGWLFEDVAPRPD